MASPQRIRRRQLLTQAEGYLELGMADSALHAIDRWVAERPLDGRALYLKGEALRTLERYSEAIECLQQAAISLPDDMNLHLAAAWCYKRLGRLDDAIDALHGALDTSPGEPILYYNLACYYSLAGEKETALSHLARALEIDGEYRELVDDEPDFDPVRDDPEFRRLTSVIV